MEQTNGFRVTFGLMGVPDRYEILYASLYWRARNAVNFLARGHYVPPPCLRPQRHRRGGCSIHALWHGIRPTELDELRLRQWWPSLSREV